MEQMEPMEPMEHIFSNRTSQRTRKSTVKNSSTMIDLCMFLSIKVYRVVKDIFVTFTIVILAGILNFTL